MSDRATFLIGYAEKRIGRTLTESEIELVSKEVMRKAVRVLCESFLEEKKPAKVSKPKKVESVKNEKIQSSSSKSTE